MSHLAAQFKPAVLAYVAQGTTAPLTPQQVEAMWKRTNDKVVSARRPLLMAAAVEHVSSKKLEHT